MCGGGGWAWGGGEFYSWMDCRMWRLAVCEPDRVIRFEDSPANQSVVPPDCLCRVFIFAENC